MQPPRAELHGSPSLTCSPRGLSRQENDRATFFWNGPMAFLTFLANCTLSNAEKLEALPSVAP